MCIRDRITIDSVQNSSCFSFDYNDAFIDVTVTGGSGLLLYIWEGDNGFFSNSQNIYDLFSDDYTLNVNDCNQNPDCIVTEYIELEEISLKKEASKRLCFSSNTETSSKF